MQKETVVEVNGLEIKKGTIYKITNKLDMSAPSGFVKEGTTKLPSVGIGNTVPCRYVITNKVKNTGLYDTGLYVDSPCYSTKNPEEVKVIVSNLQKHIVEPYERKYGRGILDHSNTEFWDNFGVNLFAGRFFVSDRIDDLLELYISVLSFELTPKSLSGSPTFRNSQYCVEDKEKVKAIKDERAVNTMDAITNFGILLKTNKGLLINLLKYVQLLGVTDKLDDYTLKAIFDQWLRDSEVNVTNFQNVYELTQNKKTSEVVNIYGLLLDLAKRGVIKRVNNEYSFNGINLGPDLKTAANNLNSKKELKETKIQLLEM